MNLIKNMLRTKNIMRNSILKPSSRSIFSIKHSKQHNILNKTIFNKPCALYNCRSHLMYIVHNNNNNLNLTSSNVLLLASSTILSNVPSTSILMFSDWAAWELSHRIMFSRHNILFQWIDCLLLLIVTVCSCHGNMIGKH